MPAYTDTPLGGMGLNPSFGQGAGLRRIEPHEPVIIDFAGCVDGYLSDQTRVFSVGELSDRLRRAYDDMLEIQALMTRVAEVGIGWGMLYDVCFKRAVEMGYADNFMGAKGSQVSFIGHGLGVEIDEYPFIARGFNQMPLETGMVLFDTSKFLLHFLYTVEYNCRTKSYTVCQRRVQFLPVRADGSDVRKPKKLFIRVQPHTTKRRVKQWP